MGNEKEENIYKATLRCENCGRLFEVAVPKGIRIATTKHSCPNCKIESYCHTLVSSGQQILLE